MSNNRRAYYSLVVNGCTSLNLMLGLTTVLLSCHGYTFIASWCLLGSVIWDAADGFLARRWQVASEFGAQLDSLADMTSFSVGGAAFVYGWLEGSMPVWLLAPLTFWCALTGAWRLARFNANPKVSGEFTGLPTTAVATILATLYLVSPWLPWTTVGSLAAVLAALMISNLPYPKFTRVVELPRLLVVILLGLGCINLTWTIWGCTIAYLGLGPVFWLLRRVRNQPAGVASI